MGQEETLHGELSSFVAEIKDKRMIFQQDNASIATKKYFSNFEMELLPASSPHPNTILWPILARKV